MALPILQAALATDPADTPAWEAKGNALWFQGRLGEALAAYETALRQAPQRETSLYLAATLALRTKQRDAARGYAERAIQVNPWRWQYHQTLAAIHAQTGAWREAVRECQETLQLHPASLATRRLLVAGYLRTGDKAKARTEFGVVLSQSPPEQQDALRRWFEQQAR
jgi:tetratricopeptide (TPR) repeat protein